MVNPPRKETEEASGKSMGDGGALLARDPVRAWELCEASFNPATEMVPAQLPDILNPAGGDKGIVERSHIVEMSE